MATAPVETEQAPPPTTAAAEPEKAITSEALAAVTAMNVYDEDGGEVAFGSLHEDKKTIVIFVRVRRRHHNFISLCPFARIGRCFLLWGQGRMYPMQKHPAARLNVSIEQILWGAAAPIAPMVPIPMIKDVMWLVRVG